MEANEIKEAMAFFAIIFNRGDGFWARRWKFFELINNRGDTIIRSHRVMRATSLSFFPVGNQAGNVKKQGSRLFTGFNCN